MNSEKVARCCSITIGLGDVGGFEKRPPGIDDD